MEDVEIIVDVETLALCRLCIINKGRFQIGKQMQKYTKECFDIVIDSFDGMSQIICEICKTLVTEIVEVRERFKKNQDILLAKRKKLVSNDEDIAPPSPIFIDSDGDKKAKSQKHNNVSKESITSILNAQAKNKTVSFVKAVEQKVQKSEVKEKCLKSEPKPNVPIAVDSDSGSSSPELRRRKHGDQNKADEDDNSDGDYVTLANIKSNLRFMCRLCGVNFNSRVRLNGHVVSEHRDLHNQIKASCKPCSVPLHNVSFNQHQPDDWVKEWVRLRPSKILKFTPTEHTYFVVKSLSKPNIISDSSSDEDTDFEVRSKNFKRILSKPVGKSNSKSSSQKHLSHKNVKARANSSEPQHTPRPEKADSILAPVMEVDLNSDSESTNGTVEVSSTVSDINRESPSVPTYALAEDEITRIIETCYKTVKSRKLLAAPVNKSWLLTDILDMNVLTVNWVNSPIIKVSRIAGDVNSQCDNLSELPIYDSRKKVSPQAHLKLIRTTISNKVEAASTDKANPPQSNPLIIKLNKNKHHVLVRRPVSSSGASESSSKATPTPTPPDKTPPPPLTLTKVQPQILKPVKRSMPALEALPAKRVSREDVTTRNPIIVSTVSLAKPSGANPQGGSERQDEDVTSTSELQQLAAAKPLIKCKPTSLLMPSPAKDAVNPFTAAPTMGVGGGGHLPNNISPPPCVMNFANHMNFGSISLTVSDGKVMESRRDNGGQQILNGMFESAKVQPLLSSSDVEQQAQQSHAPSLPEMQAQAQAQMDNCYQFTTTPCDEYIDINTHFNIDTGVRGNLLEKLMERCSREKIVLKTQLCVSTKYCKLLRFVLTIKEKQFESPLLVSSEFIVEVCMQENGVFVLNVCYDSKYVDVEKWSNEFQIELLNALKKPDFLETMTKVGRHFSFSSGVSHFANILKDFSL